MPDAKKDERSLSVLCADVAGDARGPLYRDRQDARYAVWRCQQRIRRCVESHGGGLVDRRDGKVMAFFPDSVKALQSGIEMQQRIAELAPYAGKPLSIRVGICTGHQSKEEGYFSIDGTNPAATLSEVADSEHILLSIPKRMKLFPWSQLAADRLPDLALSCGKRQLGVFQVAWQGHDPVALKIALSQLGNELDKLCLRYKGAEIVLDGKRPLLRIGRKMDSDIALQDTRSSRTHATIERRLDRFVFVDRSTNGTFVTLEDQIEFFVHHKELVLFGQGQLSLGAPSSAPGAELVQFQTSGFP